MLSDDAVHCSLKAGYPVHDSKQNCAKLINFTIGLKLCVSFLFTSDGYLVVGTLQVQGTVVSKTRNLIDQNIFFQEWVGIKAGESVNHLFVIHH